MTVAVLTKIIRRFDQCLSPFWLMVVAVLTAVVAVLECRRFDVSAFLLSPFWTCRRYDRYPWAPFAYPGNKWRARCSSRAFVSLCEYNAAGFAECEHALITRKVSPPFCQRWNVAALFREMRETTSPINGNAMESAGRHQWMSLLLTTNRCQRWQTQSAHDATLPPQRVRHD